MAKKPSDLSRREFVVAGASLALASGCPAPRPSIDPQKYDHASRIAFAPDTIGLSTLLFPQTVSAGAMRSSSALLWTRAASASSVTLRVWRDVGSKSEVALVKELALDVPVDHGNIKVTVEGLAPATWYRYAFFLSDFSERSPIGNFRTAFPDDWLEPLTVGATSCASYRYRPFEPLKTLAKQPMDLWLHLGDVAYNDGADNLATFRAKWKEQLADPGYQELMPVAGTYMVWDDHEFANNFNPEVLGPNHPVITAGKRSFYETLPVEEGSDGQLWRSYRWGKTAEFFLLDCRTERKPSTRETADAQFISTEQFEWLKQALVDSPCHFKVLMNSTPITIMPPPLWGGQGDRWQGYAAQREALLAFLDSSGIENVWFLSGDFHLGLVMRVEAEGPRRRYFEICAGPAGNVNPLSLTLEPGQEANKRIAFPSNQFLFAHGAFQATTLTFDPKANSVRVRFLNPSNDDEVTYDQTLQWNKDG